MLLFVVIGFGPGDVYVNRSRERLVLLALLVVLFLLFAIVAWVMSGRIAGPLNALRMHAQRVANGDFSDRVAPVSAPELDELGDAINRITARLGSLEERQAITSMRLEAIMSGLVDAVVLTDDKSTILQLNDAALEMLGVDEAGAIGRPFVQVTRDHELAKVLRDALRGKQSPTARVVHGIDQRSLLTSARMVEGPHERLGLVVMRDISELRRLETVRREFVANVSHELRTPLASIRAMVETLEAGAIDDPEIAKDFFGRIVQEVDRLNALVEDLLDFARLEAGRAPLRLETVDVAHVLRAGAERLRPHIERAGLGMDIDIADDLPEMKLDVQRIEQVLVNLIHNAIKFTPAGGRVRVAARRETSRVIVSVGDTGVGIPLEDQSRLFERFYKSDKARRTEGTGLGLAIVKQIVHWHGGDIAVESRPGEGATFTFWLPISRKKARKRARNYALRGM